MIPSMEPLPISGRDRPAEFGYGVGADHVRRFQLIPGLNVIQR